MKNPLSLEEKVSLNRLIEHDLVTHQLSIANVATRSEKMSKVLVMHKYNHIYNILVSISILCAESDNVHSRRVSPKDLTRELEHLVAVSNEEGDYVSYCSEIKRNFKSKTPLIYSAINSLVANALMHNEKGKVRVNIEVSPFSGEVPNPIFISEDFPIFDDFIRFRVSDNGKGFPSDKPIQEYLKLGVSTYSGRRGFGLYYATLVCKFLRSHMTIDSKEGNTDVTIYHPRIDQN